MLTISFISAQLNKIYRRWFFTGMLTATGILTGVIPEFSTQLGRWNFNVAVYAQNYSKQEIINYAKAGFQVELLRQRVYREIKKQMDETPPAIVCNQKNSFNNLPQNIKSLAVNYCRESKDIVTNNNLTINRFNELKNIYDRGGDFYQQVQKTLMQIQEKK